MTAVHIFYAFSRSFSLYFISIRDAFQVNTGWRKGSSREKPIRRRGNCNTFLVILTNNTNITPQKIHIEMTTALFDMDDVDPAILPLNHRTVHFNFHSAILSSLIWPTFQKARQSAEKIILGTCYIICNTVRRSLCETRDYRLQHEERVPLLSLASTRAL